MTTTPTQLTIQGIPVEEPDELQRSGHVTKTVRFLESAMHLKKSAFQLLAVMLANLPANSPTSPVIRLPIRELKRHIPALANVGGVRSWVLRAVEALHEAYVDVREPDGHIRRYSLLSESVRPDSDAAVQNGRVELHFNPKLWPHVSEAARREAHVSYLYLWVLHFRSKWSAPLYEYLLPYVNSETTIWMDDLRQRYKIPEGRYTQPSGFARRVFYEPVAEIEAVSNLRIEIAERYYERGSLIGFRVKPSYNYDLAPESLDSVRRVDMYLSMWGFSATEKEAYYDEYSIEHMDAVISFTQSRAPDKPGRYFAKVVQDLTLLQEIQYQSPTVLTSAQDVIAETAANERRVEAQDYRDRSAWKARRARELLDGLEPSEQTRVQEIAKRAKAQAAGKYAKGSVVGARLGEAKYRDALYAELGVQEPSPQELAAWRTAERRRTEDAYQAALRRYRLSQEGNQRACRRRFQQWLAGNRPELECDAIPPAPQDDPVLSEAWRDFLPEYMRRAQSGVTMSDDQTDE